MSIIMPAGNSKFKWVPEVEKETKMEKTASAETDVKEVEEDLNPLYEAAKGFFKQKKIEAGSKCQCSGGDCDCGDKCECKSDGGSCKQIESCAMSDDLPEITDEVVGEEGGFGGDDEVEVEIGEDGEIGDVSTPETVEEAVVAVEEAVEDLKEVAGVGEEGDDEAEIDIEVVDDFEVNDDGGEGEDDEIVIESMPMMAGSKKATKEAGTEKDASSEDDYIKLSMISPKNRQKVVSFWRDMLGYPADYVNLMAKDYEK